MGRADELRNEDTKEQLKFKLVKLIEDIENSGKGCYDIKEYPRCPRMPPPGPKEVPHPYLPGRTVTVMPSPLYAPLKVTLDGRLAQPYLPPHYFYEKPPYRVPPWSSPRYSSVELRAGNFRSGCECWKKNGMQDNCERWDCGGRPECEVLRCPPSFDPPLVGVRHRNAFDSVTHTSVPKEEAGMPYNMAEIESFTKRYPPKPPMKGATRPEEIPQCPRVAPDQSLI